MKNNRDVIDNEEFVFSDMFEDFYDGPLETLHQRNFFGKEKFQDTTGGRVVLDLVQKTYDDLITTNKFKLWWSLFVSTVVKEYFDNEPIYCQKLPSFRIFPSGYQIKYVDKVVDGFNAHLDAEPPFYHPLFEQNFWMPLIDCDHLNDLYFFNLHEGWHKRANIEKNQIMHFSSDIVHGNKVHNKSWNTRASIDFKAFKVKDYKPEDLSDTLMVLKRGKYYKQSEWYSDQHYYDIF